MNKPSCDQFYQLPGVGHGRTPLWAVGVPLVGEFARSGSSAVDRALKAIFSKPLNDLVAATDLVDQHGRPFKQPTLEDELFVGNSWSGESVLPAEKFVELGHMFESGRQRRN